MRGSDPDAAIYWLGPDAGGRRGRPVHRPADGDLRQRGRRAWPTPRRWSSPRRPPTPSSSSGCRRPSSTWPRPSIHLATAPKSNRSALAIWNARADIAAGALGEVPAHLRDSHYQGAKVLGHGTGYEYPHEHDHDELGAWVDQRYLPDELADRHWYRPSRHGHEQEVAERMSASTDTTGRGDDGMTAGELLLVVAAVLCALAFAALAVTLVRVRDTLGSLRAEVAELRAETTPLLAELRTSADEADAAMAAARADLDRFDRVLGSAEAISATAARSSRIARTTLSAPMIKAAGLATGTSPRRAPAAPGGVMRRVVWFAGGVAAGAAGAGLRQAQGQSSAARAMAPANVARGAARGAGAAGPAAASPTPSARAVTPRQRPRARAAGRARRTARPPRRPPPARRRGARRRRAGRVGAGDPDAPPRGARRSEAAATPRSVARGRRPDRDRAARRAGTRPGARRHDRAVAVPPRRLAHDRRRRRRLLPDVDGRGPGVRVHRGSRTACRSSPAGRAPVWPAAPCRRRARSSSRRRR